MTRNHSRDDYVLWGYNPSVPAAVIFAILFAVVTGIHGWAMFKTRAWICIPIFLGGIFEIVGYASRCAAHDNLTLTPAFLTSNVTVLVAPALFATSFYKTLSQIIRSVNGEVHSIVRLGWLTTTFVVGDVFSFIVICGGASLLVTPTCAQSGSNIIILGLFLQIIMFALFAIIAINFQHRLHRSPTTESYTATVPWKETLYMLYGVSFLIIVRSIFRVVEYVMGQSGYLTVNEWTLYVFDGLLMLIVMVVFYNWYPSKLQAKSDELESLEMTV